jgi:type III pantothenate kinase
MERPFRCFMLITVDVGNTNIGLGIFRGRRLAREERWETDPRRSAADWRRQMARRLRNLTGPWEGVVYASVVPAVDAALFAALRGFFKVPVLKVTPRLPLPVQNGYRTPGAVGADRLLAAVAAKEEFGAPVIVVDFGTAITVEAVSRDGVYLGGAILPGLRLAAEALERGTALLPRLTFDRRRPVRAWGRMTRESLESGLVLGAAGAVSRLVAAVRKQLGPRTPVVATGGMAPWVLPHCPELKNFRPHLIHEGLRLAWAYQQDKQ